MEPPLELPYDALLEEVMTHLDPDSILAACREQLPVEPAVQRTWRTGRVVEALYHPHRYIRIAYAFLPVGSTPKHRYFPQGDIVYLHAPLREPMSRRGHVVKLGRTSVEVYRFPNDRRLRGLRKFAAPDAALAIWQAWMDKDDTGERLEPQSLQRLLLRYVPEQKWVVRLRAVPVQPKTQHTHKRRVTVRSASPSVCAALLDRHLAVRRFSKQSHARFHAARVIGHDPQLGLLAVKWAHGKHLLEMLKTQPPGEVMRDVVTVLRSFHAAPVPHLSPVTRADLHRHVRDAVADLTLTCPDLRKALAGVEHQWGKGLDDNDTGDPVTLHNDLHWNQLRVDGQRFTFLDLERMALGDPLIDIANLATQVRMLGERPEFTVEAALARAWADEVLRTWEAVSSTRINGLRFRCYGVVSLLNLARGMMRHLRPGWRPLAQRCVELAEAELSAGDRMAMIP